MKYFLFDYYAFRASIARNINKRVDWERKMVRIHQEMGKKIKHF